MDNIIEIIEKIVDKKLKSIYCGEIGIVTEVFPHKEKSDYANYTCHIKLKNPDANNNFLELRYVPIASNHIGTVAIPNIGDMVLIQFVQGSLHQPIITGRLYHSEMRPPLCTTNEVVQQIPPGDKKDNEIVYLAIRNHDDKPRQISLHMKPKVEIEIDETKCTIELADKKTAIKMIHEKEGTISIHSQDTKITLEENKNITIEAPKNITLKAQKDIILEGSNIKIQAQQKIIAKSNSQTQIKSSGPIKLKGTTVDLN